MRLRTAFCRRPLYQEGKSGVLENAASGRCPYVRQSKLYRAKRFSPPADLRLQQFSHGSLIYFPGSIRQPCGSLQCPVLAATKTRLVANSAVLLVVADGATGLLRATRS